MISIPTRAAEFREQFATQSPDRKTWIADGAIATLLFARGASTHRPVEELNLKLAAMVRDVHRDYLAAGAEILRTNTFGANRIRLAEADLATKLTAINNAGVRIAREVAQDKAFVAGCIGPTGLRLAPLGHLTFEEAKSVFHHQALTLTGVDLFVLETFRSVEELRAAAEGVREAAGSEIVVVAHVSVEEDGRLEDGTSPERYGPMLNALHVDAIGINCSSGPHSVFRTLDRLGKVTDKPLSSLPGCGGSPDYFAARFENSGVRIAGGCCGTTPEHIRALRDVHIGEAQTVRTVAAVTEPKPKTAAPFAEHSKLSAKLAARDFVLIADLHSADVAAAKKAKKAGIDAIGLPNRAAMNTLGAARLIEDKAGLEAIVYTVAKGRSAGDLQRDLLATNALDVHNVLCVTGVGWGKVDIDSIGLTRIASGLNHGLDFGGNELGAQTSLAIGVAVNPFAADLDHEIARLDAKIRAGAEYAITQPIFDLLAYEEFLRRVESLSIPMIASVLPLDSIDDANFAASELHLPVPETVRTRIAAGESQKVMQELVAALRENSAGLRITTRGSSIEAALAVALH